jgi:hypothetical protein
MNLADAGATIIGVVLNRARGRVGPQPRSASSAVEQSRSAPAKPAPSTSRPGGELVRPPGIVGPATDGS